jgi:drug/metabolite transporter (DMT)-like permease
VLTLLDGGGLATSNVTFVLAMSYGSSAVATVIVESWPVLATVAMAAVLARFRPLVPRQVPWMLVCLGGFVVLVGSSGSGGAAGLSVAPLAVLLAVVAALTQAVAVTANQKVLEDLPRASPSATLLTQAVRMLVGAGVCAAGAAVAHPSSAYAGVPAASAVLLGCTIGVSALLFTLSLRRAVSPAVTLLWFLTPAMSVLLLVAAGQAQLTPGVVTGTAVVLAASLALMRGSDPAPPGTRRSTAGNALG